MALVEKPVMRKATIVAAAVIVTLLVADFVRAEASRIVNGSFEDDGWIKDVMVKDPNGWQVNTTGDRFRGYVDSDWPTDGSYNLTLYADFWKLFDAGDTATVSQELNLTDVNEIIFDLKLDTSAFTPWDPGTCSAVVLIDDDVVWDSNDLGADVRGEYPGQMYPVSNKYRDGQPHTLSLGIRVNVSEQLWDRYITHWDFVEYTLYCGGGGLLQGDFNRDCYVDMTDLIEVADSWLGQVQPHDRFNLSRTDDTEGYGSINFLDFAVYANQWMNGAAELALLADKWLTDVDLQDSSNLFHEDDVQPRGIVNFPDVAILANNWLGSSYVEIEPPPHEPVVEP